MIRISLQSVEFSIELWLYSCYVCLTMSSSNPSNGCCAVLTSYVARPSAHIRTNMTVRSFLSHNSILSFSSPGEFFVFQSPIHLCVVTSNVASSSPHLKYWTGTADDTDWCNPMCTGLLSWRLQADGLWSLKAGSHTDLHHQGSHHYGLSLRA